MVSTKYQLSKDKGSLKVNIERRFFDTEDLNILMNLRRKDVKV